MAETWTADELVEHLSKISLEIQDARWLRNTKNLMNVWLERGDGVAVYQNVDLGHPQLGHTKYLSFGSETSQFETDEPPAQLPDFPHEINWRYHLKATYRGAPLP